MNGKNTISSKRELTVLVVDTPIVTDFLNTALIYSGHSPVIFNDEKIAREEFQRNPEAFDAVIVDTRIFSLASIQELIEYGQLPVLIWSQSASANNIELNNNQVTILKKTINYHFNEIKSWLDEIESRTIPKEAKKLFSLMYVSKKVDNFEVKDLIQILHKARENNKRRDVTGVLIYNKGYFLQILEGDMAIVNSLFNGLILKDTRHENVAVLSQNFITQRDFANWDMGFYGTTSPDSYNLLGNTDLDIHPAGILIKQRLEAVRNIINGFF